MPSPNILPPRLRKFALTAHIVSSVGWLAAVIAFFPLVVAVMVSRDVETVRAAYLAMELVGCSRAEVLSEDEPRSGAIRFLWNKQIRITSYRL